MQQVRLGAAKPLISFLCGCYCPVACYWQRRKGRIPPTAAGQRTEVAGNDRTRWSPASSRVAHTGWSRLPTSCRQPDLTRWWSCKDDRQLPNCDLQFRSAASEEGLELEVAEETTGASEQWATDRTTAGTFWATTGTFAEAFMAHPLVPQLEPAEAAAAAGTFANAINNLVVATMTTGTITPLLALTSLRMESTIDLPSAEVFLSKIAAAARMNVKHAILTYNLSKWYIYCILFKIKIIATS